MPKKTNKSKKLSPAQIRARKDASARLKALNASRRTAATSIARASSRAARRTAAKINRADRVKARAIVTRRANRALDSNFW